VTTSLSKFGCFPGCLHRHVRAAAGSSRRDANNTASGTRPSITSLERLFIAALAEVVSSGMDNNSSTDNALGTDNLDQWIGHGTLRVALAISLDVTKVADMAVLVRRRAVALAMRVEVRSSRGATVGIVAKGVNMHATLRIGVMALDIPGDLGGRGLGILLERDRSGDLRVASNDADCLDHCDDLIGSSPVEYFVSAIGFLLF